MNKDSLSGLPDSLREALKADAEASEVTRWKPDSGQYLYGKIVKYEFPKGSNGRFPVVVLDTKEGPFSFIAHVVLSNKLVEAAAQLGDEVVVNPLGKHPTKGYWDYAVAITRHGDRDPAIAYTGTPPGDEPAPIVTRSQSQSGGDPWSGEPSNGDQMPF